MSGDLEKSLLQNFGYVPNEKDGEKWVVYNGRLIVIHPERRPRIYRRGGTGAEDYYEVDPYPYP